MCTRSVFYRRLTAVMTLRCLTSPLQAHLYDDVSVHDWLSLLIHNSAADYQRVVDDPVNAGQS